MFIARIYSGSLALQSLFRLIYPPRCAGCGALVEDEGGLCGACWRETPFIAGLVCDLCGVPLPGETEPGSAEHCDDCLGLERPWVQGRAALVYRGEGRRLVLALKHGDRHDLVAPAAGWMARAVAPLVPAGTVVIPVPVHWRRLAARRFNQAALLAQAVARRLDLECLPTALRRPRFTGVQDGRDRDQRFANLADAIRPAPGAAGRLSGKPVLLVDDVMTSGATLTAAAEACRAAGGGEVRVLVLARVAKDA